MFRQLKGRTGATDFDITEEVSAEGGFGQGSEGEMFGEIKKEVDAKIY